jgi:hypothetical protein
MKMADAGNADDFELVGQGHSPRCEGVDLGPHCSGTRCDIRKQMLQKWLRQIVCGCKKSIWLKSAALL